MAINLKLPEFRKLNKGKLPTKTHINVLVERKQPFSLRKNLPLLIIVVVLALLLCKFLVYDRLASVIREAGRVETLQQELIEVNARIDKLKDVDEMYAHYTTSGMTAEELGQVDRVKAMRLIEDAFLHGNISKNWNLTGNVMTMEVNGPSLKDLNQLAEELEEDPVVERCVISAADKHLDENGNVSVTFVVYLQKTGE
ncbi:MAG: hypothetical protein Q4F96_01595 [Bacillota bacterium]|nr:hypothetical protein [Bacillota bacterium]